MNAPNSIDEAIKALRRDPSQSVRATVGDVTLELRLVSSASQARPAAEAFDEIGPWVGETTEEMLSLLADARRRGGNRTVAGL